MPRSMGIQPYAVDLKETGPWVDWVGLGPWVCYQTHCRYKGDRFMGRLSRPRSMGMLPYGVDLHETGPVVGLYTRFTVKFPHSYAVALKQTGL